MVSSRPVPIRLSPDEMARLEEYAKKESRSLSSFLRLAALRGMADYDSDPRSLLEAPTTAKA